MTATLPPGIDHLVVVARDLDHGAAFVESRLGIPLTPGGRHPMWGTHNLLASLGDGTYLEVLAPDPEATAPPQGYPFGLGDPRTVDRLADGPFLAHWVVRIDSLPDAEEFCRGASRWRLDPSPGGPLEVAGIVPTRIAWLTPHPTTLLPPSDGHLDGLVITTPDPSRVRERIGDGVRDLRLAVEQGSHPGLDATLTTSLGRVTLTSR